MGRRVLIVEDDDNLAEGLAYNLERAGYEVSRAPDGPRGLEAARRDAPDLIVLDLMLPGLPGFEVLRRLRAGGVRAPVLILSAVDDEAAKVRGFDLGAVDYVTKPFGLAELLARIRVRLGDEGAAEGDVLRLGEATVRLGACLLEREGEDVTLTPTEVRLLRELHERRGKPVSRDDLTRSIWGLGGKATRTLDAHVARLRRKIEPDPAHPRHLVTVHGFGYRLLS